MIDNRKVSDMLEKMAVLLEFEGENPFKIRAYKRASEIIANYPKSVDKLSVEELENIHGIGKRLAYHIKDIVEKGSFEEYEKLRRKYPESLFEILEIEGLGAKRVKLLYDKLKIDTKEKLIEAAKKGLLKNLEGFGPKLEKTILENIEKNITESKRFLYHYAKLVALEIIRNLKALGYKDVYYAGSLRRCKETIGDLDIIVVGNSSVIDKFLKFDFIDKVLAVGEKKVSVNLKSGIQCDLRVFPKESLGASLCYFTGSKAHNIKLRNIALKKGYTLNEYGLFKNYGSKEKVAGRTEEEIYRKLGMQFIPPELREDRGEVEAALEHRLPKLVELKDIKGEAHCHTKYTDGQNDYDEIIKYAISRKYKWFFIADHSSPLNFVNGLSYEDYKKTREKLLEISEKYRNIKVDRSIELEILKDGTLGYKNSELENIPFIIGAVHTALKLDIKDMTERIIKAISNPYLDAVAHPSQRLLNQREGIKVDYDLIFETAGKLNTLFEINGQPDRLDLNDTNIMKAKSFGLKFLLSSDAHSIEQFDYIEYALNTARRGWLTRDDIVNTYAYSELISFINESRKKRKEIKV